MRRGVKGGIVMENEKNNAVFKTLYQVDVSKWIEKKNTGKATLSYLSWANAWAEVKKRYPEATYEVVKFENGLPYAYDPKTGYMVYTKITIDGVTHEMWLPVMDSHNEAMLDHARQVKTKYSSYTVEACTMFDVNKTIMRCLTKNIGMFGLGLYIYAGEDLPADLEAEEKTNAEVTSWKNKFSELDKKGLMDEKMRQQVAVWCGNKNFDSLAKAEKYLIEKEKQKGLSDAFDGKTA